MEKLKFNPSNKKYYSEEFIKGFECGAERQFKADSRENTAEWRTYFKEKDHIYHDFLWYCSNCKEKFVIDGKEEMRKFNYCPNCGSRCIKKGEDNEKTQIEKEVKFFDKMGKWFIDGVIEGFNEQTGK